MQVIFKDGPHDGEYAYLPKGTTQWRMAEAMPIDWLRPLSADIADVANSMPTYRVSAYRFSGAGLCTSLGAVTALIFQYEGTHDG